MPTQFKRVLILSASAGAGHMRAADALVKAFTLENAAEEVKHIDALTLTNPLFRTLYAKAYLKLVGAAPDVLGWIYKRLDKPWKEDPLQKAFNKLNTVPLVKMLETFQPDLAICTHFLPAEIILRLNRKRRIKCPVAVTVTDLDAHAMWLMRNVDTYFVAMEETRVYMEALGVEPGRVHVTGIPIDPAFSAPIDRATAAKALGLDPKLPTILISAGGFGVGNVELLVQEMAKIQHAAQVVAICGRNEKLKASMEKTVAALPPGAAKIHVIGFTDQMHNYMAAADILLGKPGGLTMSEALTRGLVFVIVTPIPGQEERNSDHLLEEGCAIRCNNIPALAYKVDRLLADPARLAIMKANALRLAKPHAARDVVRILTRDQQ